MTEPFEFKTKRNVNKSYLESFDMVDARLTQSFEPLWSLESKYKYFEVLFFIR